MKLHVADEVRSMLGVEDVERTIAIPNTMGVRCPVCGGTVPAGSSETVNVLVSETARGGQLVQYAHAGCHPSAVIGRRADWSLRGGLVARFRVREHPVAPAVLVWEPYQEVRIVCEDVHTRFYRWLGLRPSRRGTAAADGPWLNTLTVNLAGSRAWVALSARGVRALARKVPEHRRLRVGEMWDEFSLRPADAACEWREAAARTGRCLLVTGTGLGLEHPSLEREDLLLELGCARAGIAPVHVIADTTQDR